MPLAESTSGLRSKWLRVNRHWPDVWHSLAELFEVVPNVVAAEVHVKDEIIIIIEVLAPLPMPGKRRKISSSITMETDRGGMLPIDEIAPPIPTNLLASSFLRRRKGRRADDTVVTQAFGLQLPRPMGTRALQSLVPKS
jgi:hypothetical protein